MTNHNDVADNDVADNDVADSGAELMSTDADANPRSTPGRPIKDAVDPAHVSTVYFAERFRELAARMSAEDLTTGRTGRLTPFTIGKLLQEQAPALPVSQTQIYRYFHGEAPPRLDVVYELARLFGVQPSYFVADYLLSE